MDALDPRHGTNAGHRAHITDSEPICQPCREAHNAYRRSLWRKRYLLRCDRLYISSTGTIRRIRALQALGWRLRDLDAALGHGNGEPRGGSNYTHNLTRQPQVHRDTAEKVARVYDELSMRLGPSERTRTLARKYGWAPPLAWDDIDDPNEEPTGWRYQSTDRAEVIRDMADMGLGVTEVSRRLHTSAEALQAWCMRKGMSAVYRQLAAREALHENQWTRKDGAA